MVLIQHMKEVKYCEIQIFDKANYQPGLLIFWYFLRLHIFESSEVPDVTLLNLFEEVIAESDGEHEIPARRELLPLMLYQELFREKWVWQCK